MLSLSKHEATGTSARGQTALIGNQYNLRLSSGGNRTEPAAGAGFSRSRMRRPAE